METDDLFIKIEEAYQDSNIELRYNRERRLENAPETVKLLHSPDYIKRQSFFASIWSNRGHRFIFIAILILVSLNISIFFYYYSSNTGKVSGIKVEMDTFQYGNDILVNIVFNESQNVSEKNIKVYARGLNAKGEEVSFSETQSIYIGVKLILHFKIENKDINKVEAVVLVDKNVLTLSKRI